MLSEERIRKMIRLADYEKGIGNSDLKRTHYWRMDYVRMQILKTILAVFVAFVLGILLSVLYHMDYVMQHVWELPYRTILIYGGIVFVAVEILFVIFTVRIAGRAYDESRARVKEYYVTLMELEELYEKEGEEETL